MTEILPPLRTTHRFDAAGGRWCFDLWAGTGRPVVLIPAVLFDRTCWWPAAADLRPYATVVAVDLPGHGGSPGRDHYDPGDLVDDLATLIASLQLRRAPVVVGHGPSAALAALFAARYATHAVVAVDPIPTEGLCVDVDTYLRDLQITELPEQYRGLVRTSTDPRLLSGYAAGLRHCRPATTPSGVTAARLAVYSRPPFGPETHPQAADRWRQEIYDVPGRFAALAAGRRFITDLRTLL
ncbi:alpha/beta fold hydrolase [Actinoplanes flavus]|uniref:Alpha/beta hydrolase n=1 Tax=Actinoplanes flavus TaxID=2820290 RepID=A0ABS3UG03_9ACTN|nr:alpha/beta hydrolase [Actinoplanes flavus]MBO3737712.1 alpha/beta hydrolase [Actinoplanes flavus]